MLTVIVKGFKFEAAHRLVHHNGACRRPHGHSYQLLVFARGEPKPVERDNPQSDEGMVMDYEKLGEIVHREVLDGVDHYDLNSAAPVDTTTTELLAEWMLRALHEADLRIFKVRLSETSSTFAEVEID